MSDQSQTDLMTNNGHGWNKPANNTQPSYLSGTSGKKETHHHWFSSYEVEKNSSGQPIKVKKL